MEKYVEIRWGLRWEGRRESAESGEVENWRAMLTDFVMQSKKIIEELRSVASQWGDDDEEEVVEMEKEVVEKEEKEEVVEEGGGELTLEDLVVPDENVVAMETVAVPAVIPKPKGKTVRDKLMGTTQVKKERKGGKTGKMTKSGRFDAAHDKIFKSMSSIEEFYTRSARLAKSTAATDSTTTTKKKKSVKPRVARTAKTGKTGKTGKGSGKTGKGSSGKKKGKATMKGVRARKPNLNPRRVPISFRSDTAYKAALSKSAAPGEEENKAPNARKSVRDVLSSPKSTTAKARKKALLSSARKKRAKLARTRSRPAPVN